MPWVDKSKTCFFLCYWKLKMMYLGMYCRAVWYVNVSVLKEAETCIVYPKGGIVGIYLRNETASHLRRLLFVHRNYKQNFVKLMFGHSSLSTVLRLLEPTQTKRRLIVFLGKKLLSSTKLPEGHFGPHSLLLGGYSVGDKMAYVWSWPLVCI